jgi:hypothetical protein
LVNAIPGNSFKTEIDWQQSVNWTKHKQGTMKKIQNYNTVKMHVSH